jgi:hypothetical protein
VPSEKRVKKKMQGIKMPPLLAMDSQSPYTFLAISQKNSHAGICHQFLDEV